MFKKIHSSTIVVSDQNAALDFYVNKLGWEKRIDVQVSPEYRFLTVAPVGGESELVLGPAEMHTVKPGAGISSAEYCGVPGSGISFTVENIDETYQTLVERGVRFTGPPEVMPWGDRATWLIDPDGNGFFFIEG